VSCSFGLRWGLIVQFLIHLVGFFSASAGLPPEFYTKDRKRAAKHRCMPLYAKAHALSPRELSELRLKFID